jgi:catechol 2,3-dioxygenase-like lactoylglutathione lyase family enzyme
MPPRDPQSTHVRLLVEDYRACFEFYADVLGIEATFGDADSGYADFDAGGDTALALFDREEMLDAVEAGSIPGDAGGDGDSPGDRVVLVFGVDPVTAPMDRPEWGSRTAHVRGPAGTVIECNEPL